MSYNKKVWKSGDRITKEALNNMENGIEAAHQNSGGSGTSYDDTAIKADIQTLKTNEVNLVEDETSMEGIKDNEYPTLTTTNKTLIGGINELNTQYKDIANQLKNPGRNAYKVYNVLNYNISTDAEDNSPALQTLMNTVSSNGGGTIFFPIGTYNFKKAGQKYAIYAKSNVSIIGENIEKTILKCSEALPYALFYYMGDVDTPITGCSYSNFTVDGYSTGNNNSVEGKAFYYQYVKNSVFRDIILQGTVATALGIDYLDNVEINNVTCIDCGRTYTGTETGTSGIGIGTGGWENENFKITNCVTVGCGQYGIFIENQHTQGWGGNTENPKGCIISNCITRNGLNKGIGIRGGTNVIVSNCNSYENTQDGIYLENKCVNVKISNNNVIQNSGNGIVLATNTNSVDIDINDNLVKGNIKYGIDLETSTNGLMLRHNVTKNNSKGGLYSKTDITHSNTVANNNIFLDGENTINTMFINTTIYNDLIKDANADITAITCNNFSIKKGDTKSVNYSVLPKYADKSKVTISTTDTNITVNNDAKTITGVHEGTATITLSSGNITTTATVTVQPTSPQPTSEKVQILESSNFTKGYKLTPTGAQEVESISGVTDYIDVSNYTQYKASYTNATAIRIAQYNSNKTSLSTNFPIGGGITEFTSFMQGAKYIRIMITDCSTSSTVTLTLKK